MSTEFISFLAPPGDAIKDYNRTLPPAQQPQSIPQVFLDAMAVREDVFVKEQHVALERERDDEDQRCYHWVAYASVGAPKGSKESAPVVQRGFGATSSANGRRRSSSGEGARLKRERSASTASSVPVGVIRLVPPAPPLIERRRSSAKSSSPPLSEDEQYPHPTAFPGEPYIKLGRLATLKEFRGLGLSKLLTNAALQFARHHPEAFAPDVSPTEIEAGKQEGLPSIQLWRGLVYVHAQKDRTMGLWKKWGFHIDEGMGEWDEEGMMHVGMWKRLELAS